MTTWDRVKELFWKVMASVLVVVVVSSPGWLWVTVTYGYSTIKTISENKDGVAEIKATLVSERLEWANWEEERQKEYQQIQRQLSDLKILWGLATISNAGDEMTAAINVGGPAVRIRQGVELWITNNTDPDETKIKVKVEGTFKAGPSYLLRLSREAGNAIEASRAEIQVQVEPVEEGETEDG